MDKTKALQNLLKGKATKKEIELLKQALVSGEISIGRKPSTNYDHEYSNPDGRSSVGMESVIVRLFVKDLIRGWFAKA